MIKKIIELESGKFADIEFEGGTHVWIKDVENFTKATMFENEEDINGIYNDMLTYNKVGWGIDSVNSEFRYYGECIVPVKIREVEIKLL